MKKSIKKKKSRKNIDSSVSQSDSFLFDIDYINNTVKYHTNLKTVLKKVKRKGVGIFANRTIKNGEVVCYYLVKAFNYKTFPNKYNSVYTIELYTKNGKAIQNMIGDISEESLRMPDLDGIAYWGYFSNEPSKKQDSNTFLDINLDENYAYRKKLKEGDMVLYKLIATRDIKKGEEITWCYGSLYYREYDTSCRDV